MRHYGTQGRRIILLHGGPGAPGYLAPLGRKLGERFRVIEPFQRRSSDEPLTVARHVADLRDIVASLSCEATAASKSPAAKESPGRQYPVLVGHSWGAMLSLAYAAEHPHTISAVVLVGCGTCTQANRQLLEQTRAQRLSPDEQLKLAELARAGDDPDSHYAALGWLLARADSYNLLPPTRDDDPLHCDARGGQETWANWRLLEAQGVYPQAFNAITAPVLMLHGHHDPHPGREIAAVLRQYVGQLEYHEFAHCGHYPWRERYARDEFFEVLTAWLTRNAGS
ncbi:MAG: alpha/beta hydrolase [Sedimentisphaerales bacterium]|nr:alpha/beta hydrolase [Sedimentisphaerales bacterium]